MLKDDDDVRVFVAEGCRLPKNPKTIEAARKIGEYLGKKQYVYLQGCSEYGLMGVTYNEFIKYNKKVKLVDLSVVYFDSYRDGMVGERLPNQCLNTRLKTFADNTDIIVVLPGANGTVHEFVTFLEINRQYPHAYEIVLVNIDGYYDKLLEFYKVQEEEGLCTPGEFNDLVNVVDNVDDALELIHSYRRRPAVNRFIPAYLREKDKASYNSGNK